MPSSSEQSMFFDMGFNCPIEEATNEAWAKLIERVNNAGKSQIKSFEDKMNCQKLQAVIFDQSEAIELLKLAVSHCRMFITRQKHPEWYPQHA